MLANGDSALMGCETLDRRLARSLTDWLFDACTSVLATETHVVQCNDLFARTSLSLVLVLAEATLAEAATRPASFRIPLVSLHSPESRARSRRTMANRN